MPSAPPAANAKATAIVAGRSDSVDGDEAVWLNRPILRNPGAQAPAQAPPDRMKCPHRRSGMQIGKRFLRAAGTEIRGQQFEGAHHVQQHCHRVSIEPAVACAPRRERLGDVCDGSAGSSIEPAPSHASPWCRWPTPAASSVAPQGGYLGAASPSIVDGTGRSPSTAGISLRHRGLPPSHTLSGCRGGPRCRLYGH